MQLPLTDPDTLFEELLQDLPPETVPMAREFKAFVRAKKVKTPGQLLRVVFLYGSALHVMLFLKNLIRALWIFNGLRSRHCLRALLVYHYPLADLAHVIKAGTCIEASLQTR